MGFGAREEREGKARVSNILTSKAVRFSRLEGRGLRKSVVLTLAEAGVDVLVANFGGEINETVAGIQKLGRRSLVAHPSGWPESERASFCLYLFPDFSLTLFGEGVIPEPRECAQIEEGWDQRIEQNHPHQSQQCISACVGG